ncbi:MAG: FAD-dependent oxidoreductase [Desulfobacteraceae bacterium]|jgi:NADPH-dependent glutamate synthase beta subunit-like oxidoreductase/NAD-dependent dihydropyrimidine dehydrogenase PreA subunit
MTLNKGILIIGAMPPGLQAALTLANLDRHVTLVETGFEIPPSPRKWSGKGRRWHQFLRSQVSYHPLIELLTETEATRIHEGVEGFDVELTQRPQWVLAHLCVDCQRCISACPVELPDGRKPIFERITPTSMAIDKREKAPCRSACPIGMNPQGYVALIAQQRFDEADDLIREVNPLPGVCGRICHHPCETACRRQELDEPIAICALKRFVADEARKNRKKRAPEEVSPPYGPPIAIIGSGPAGLTAAHDLAKAGLRATLIEAEDKPGGLPIQAIAPFRLPREILEQEIKDILSLGVELRLHTPVRSLEDLERLKADGFSAVLLATGASKDLRLQIEGEDLEGIYGCVSFLRELWSGQVPKSLGQVVVIGGGNAAVEAARASLRAGAEKVSLVCLENHHEMPAWEHEIEAALEEGVEIINSFGPRRFLKKDGRLSAVEFKRCKAVFDENGAFKPQYDETDLTTMVADTAITAIGQAPNLLCEDSSQELAIASNGETNLPRVYACGDVVSGPSTVVEAMASGRRAAGRIIRDLRPSAGTLEEKGPETILEEYDPIPKEMPKLERRPLPHRKISERIKDNREVIGPYPLEDAIKEAARCLQCGLCSECLRCEISCDLGAIGHDRVAAQRSFHFDQIIVCDDTQLGRDLHGSRWIKVTSDGKKHSWARAVAEGRTAAMSALARTAPVKSPPIPTKTPCEGDLRVGVFICSCNGTLNEDNQLEEMIGPLEAWPEVAHAEVLISACHPEKGLGIEEVVDEKGLNAALIASCTCCHLDFACESCNDQRVRLKQRLFWQKGYHPAHTALVNIKETCLLPFKGDAKRRTDLAMRVIRSGLWQLRESKALAMKGEKPHPHAVVLGATEAGIAAAKGLKTTCPTVVVVENRMVAKRVKEILQDSGIRLVCPVRPVRLDGQRGNFKLVVEKNDASDKDSGYEMISAGLIILGSPDYKGIPYRRDDFAGAFHRSAPRAFGTLETGISGVYMASWSQARSLSHEALGLSAASEALEGTYAKRYLADYLFARVDPEVCRGCGRCADLCPEGAAHLEEVTRGVATSWIDPDFCIGCGNCLAECPTGAIHMPESEQDYFEKVIHAFLG